MKLLSAAQQREADAQTIANEPISSIDLMERAAKKCADAIHITFAIEQRDRVVVFCGKGNNGGDGLAIARLLMEMQIPVTVCIVEHREKGSADFTVNKNRLAEKNCEIHSIREVNDIPALEKTDLIIDAILGTGLTQPLTGLLLDVVKHINSLELHVVAIDIPTGLFSEDNTGNSIEHVCRATTTLTFETPKLSFLFPDTGRWVGTVEILFIALDPTYLRNVQTPYYYLEASGLSFLPREKFSHKGDYGHTLLIGGNKGKFGALYFSAKAALRCGVGLCTTLPHKQSKTALQIRLPDAMITSRRWPDKLTSIAIGPGLGKGKWGKKQLQKVLDHPIAPTVFDADAINLLAENSQLTPPEGSILTPHVKEFERLMGRPFHSGFSRMQAALAFAKEKKVVLVLKGAHTLIATPTGEAYFNSTGTPALAKGGSGDMLTGMIAAFLAKGYHPVEAVKVAVWVHGKAGEIAAEKFDSESLLMDEIIDAIGPAMQRAWFSNYTDNQ